MHSASVRTSSLLAVSMCFSVSLAAQNKPRQIKQYTIEQFMDTTRIGGASISTDNKNILFHSNKTGIFRCLRDACNRRRAQAVD